MWYSKKAEIAVVLKVFLQLRQLHKGVARRGIQLYLSQFLSLSHFCCCFFLLSISAKWRKNHTSMCRVLQVMENTEQIKYVWTTMFCDLRLYSFISRACCSNPTTKLFSFAYVLQDMEMTKKWEAQTLTSMIWVLCELPLTTFQKRISSGKAVLDYKVTLILQH